MFEDKGFIKLRDGDFKSTINYIVKDGMIVGLTPEDSNKIAYLLENPEIEVADGLKSKDFIKATVKVSKDDSKEVFEEMEKVNHNHFESYDEYLAVLEFFPRV